MVVSWRGVAKSLSRLAGSQEVCSLHASDLYTNGIMKILTYGIYTRWKTDHIGTKSLKRDEKLLNPVCHLPAEVEGILQV